MFILGNLKKYTTRVYVSFHRNGSRNIYSNIEFIIQQLQFGFWGNVETIRGKIEGNENTEDNNEG